ncbi:MAG: L,D-transpeptidase [bacterium]|nr:L,D-transpeptidase [bacterium]
MIIKRKIFWLSLPFILLLGIGILYLSVEKFVLQDGCPCNLVATTGEFIPGEEEASLYGEKVSPFLTSLPSPSPLEQKVLGETSNDEKWIEVDLSEQKVRAWEGNNLFLESLVSSGKPWTPTITGEFRVWSKFHYAKMSGGVKGTKSYYYLPNVPYIMFFKGDYSLHGTYWHNNFGQRMSHGCVNLPIPIAEKLYYWTTPTVPQGKHSSLASSENPGTRIVIHD